MAKKFGKLTTKDRRLIETKFALTLEVLAAELANRTRPGRRCASRLGPTPLRS
jgi:hypothetical protein